MVRQTLLCREVSGKFSHSCSKNGVQNGYSGRRYREIKEAASLRFKRMGSFAYWGGFPPKMSGMRAPDYDCTQTGGEKYKRNYAKNMKNFL